MMIDDKIWISVSGGIAVGKTTLVGHLDTTLQDVHTIREYPERNPYLADFYIDMHQWAFHSRVAMLAMFAARYIPDQGGPQSSVVLMDRCLHELITFAELQRESGNLSGRDYETYRTLYDSFVSVLPGIDVVVYLECDPGRALERVRSRGRQFEARIDEDYIAAVNSQYQTWLDALPDRTVKLTFDSTNGLDVRAIRARLEDAIGRFRKG